MYPFIFSKLCNISFEDKQKLFLFQTKQYILHTDCCVLNKDRLTKDRFKTILQIDSQKEECNEKIYCKQGRSCL